MEEREGEEGKTKQKLILLVLFVLQTYFYVCREREKIY